MYFDESIRVAVDDVLGLHAVFRSYNPARPVRIPLSIEVEDNPRTTMSGCNFTGVDLPIMHKKRAYHRDIIDGSAFDPGNDKQKKRISAMPIIRPGT